VTRHQPALFRIPHCHFFPELFQADGALVTVEEDTMVMAKLLLVSLVAKSCKVVIGLLVGEEENQLRNCILSAAELSRM
jgi:hypothetical protein